ncbi:MAG TPA: putative glycoside hydrolase [Gemmatimonadaceae bacterium]|nr:putative glycoside hydrolase [Gemmatimonadaceae bacterium]
MMTPARIGTIAFFLVLLGCQHQGDASLQPGAVDIAMQGGPGASSTARARDSIARRVITRVPTPDTLRGLYVNRWAALGRKLNDLIGVAKRTEVNALVIDVKDDRGFVLYRSSVRLAREIGADTADGHWMSGAKLRAVLDTMAAHKIYPIARIVVAKDPLLALKRLDLAIKRKSDLKPWLDKNGRPWLDPHQREVWQYAVDLAREAHELGFSEVQFDYVRFPDEKRLISETVYPLANGRTRAQVIRDQLGFVRNALKPLGMRVTADVFGLTATDTTDMGIGQRWEMFVDQVDVVLPMIYPSHFARGTYRLRNPNAHPYQTIDHALKDAIARSDSVPNAASVIPWYQDFTLGAPRYGAAEIRAQKKAGYDNGFQSWILWNPKSNYTLAALEPQT